MVFLIWGSGSKNKNPEEAFVPYFCGRCDTFQNFAVLENYRYGHLYGVRIAKWNTTRWLQCLGCEGSIDIPDVEAFNAAKEISRSWKPLIGTEPDMSKILRVCSQVAIRVSRDVDAGKKFAELAGDMSEYQKAAEASVFELDEKFCPSCDEQRDSSENFCGECGSGLAFRAPEPQAPPGYSRWCSRCQEHRPDDAAFCVKCGFSLV